MNVGRTILERSLPLPADQTELIDLMEDIHITEAAHKHLVV